jgi:hypothetical protein
MKEEEFETAEVKNDNYQRQTIPLWFVIGTVIVTAWVAYYIYKYWGGLGPGIPQ